MIETAVRGDVTSVYKNRRFFANNIYIPNYKSPEDQQFGFCVDANNFYGGVMQLEKLLLSEFAFKTEVTFQEVLDTPDNASRRYFVRVDLSYPQGSHDDHRAFPLAATKDILEEEWLVENQFKLKEQHSLPHRKRDMWFTRSCSNCILNLDFYQKSAHSAAVLQ